MNRYGEIIHGHYGEYLTSRYGDAPDYMEQDYFLRNIAVGDNDECNQILILGTFGDVNYIWSTYCAKQKDSGVSMGYQHVVYCRSNLSALHDVSKIINFPFVDEERCRYHLHHPEQFEISGSISMKYGINKKTIHIDRSLLSKLANYCIYQKRIRAKKYLYILVPREETDYQGYCRSVIELLLSVIPDGLRSNLCIATNTSVECEKYYDILFMRERNQTIPRSIRIDQGFDQTFFDSKYWDINIQGLIQQCTCDAVYLKSCNDFMKKLFGYSAIPLENDYSFYFEIGNLIKEEDAFSRVKKCSELLGQNLTGWKYKELDELIKTWRYSMLSLEYIIRQEKESERWHSIGDMITILEQCKNFIFYLRKQGYGYLSKQLLMEELKQFSFSDTNGRKKDLYDSISAYKGILIQYFAEQDVQVALKWAEEQKNSMQFEQKISDMHKNITKREFQKAYEFVNEFCPDKMEHFLEEIGKILLTEYKKHNRNENDILQIIESMKSFGEWKKIPPELRMVYYECCIGRNSPDASVINDTFELICVEKATVKTMVINNVCQWINCFFETFDTVIPNIPKNMKPYEFVISIYETLRSRLAQIYGEKFWTEQGLDIQYYKYLKKNLLSYLYSNANTAAIGEVIEVANDKINDKNLRCCFIEDICAILNREIYTKESRIEEFSDIVGNLRKNNYLTDDARKILNKIDKRLWTHIKSESGKNFWNGKDTFETCLFWLRKWRRFIDIEAKEKIPLLKEFENKVSQWPLRRRSFSSFLSAITVLEGQSIESLAFENSDEAQDVLQFYCELWKWLSVSQKLGIVITSSSTPSKIYGEILYYLKILKIPEAYFYNNSSPRRNLKKKAKNKRTLSGFNNKCLNINDSRICLRMIIYKEMIIPLINEDIEFWENSWNKCEPCFDFFYSCGFLSKNTFSYFKNNLVDTHMQKNCNKEHRLIINKCFKRYVIAGSFIILLVGAGNVFFPKFIRENNRIVIPSTNITESSINEMEVSESSVESPIESSEVIVETSDTNIEASIESNNENNPEEDEVLEQLTSSSKLWLESGSYLDACSILDNVFNGVFDWQIMFDVEGLESENEIKETIREYLALQAYQDYLLSYEAEEITLDNIDFYITTNNNDPGVKAMSEYPVMLMELGPEKYKKYLIYCYDENKRWYINYCDILEDSVNDEIKPDSIIDQLSGALKNNADNRILPTRTKNVNAAFNRINGE